jgi:hypothetical protein
MLYNICKEKQIMRPEPKGIELEAAIARMFGWEWLHDPYASVEDCVPNDISWVKPDGSTAGRPPRYLSDGTVTLQLLSETMKQAWCADWIMSEGAMVCGKRRNFVCVCVTGFYPPAGTDWPGCSVYVDNPEYGSIWSEGRTIEEAITLNVYRCMRAWTAFQSMAEKEGIKIVYEANA